MGGEWVKGKGEGGWVVGKRMQLLHRLNADGA